MSSEERVNESFDDPTRVDTEDALAAAVLGYLREHPTAMDTLPGIADWWISRQRIRVDVSRLARVLDSLIERGILEQFGAADRRCYRLKT